MTLGQLPRIALLASALAVGLGIAILDRGQEEVQPAAFLLLVSAFAFSAARPRDAWAFALLIGVGVPALDLVMRARGVPPPWPSQPGSSLIAFLPAFLGAGAGALVRRMVRPPAM